MGLQGEQGYTGPTGPRGDRGATGFVYFGSEESGSIIVSFDSEKYKTGKSVVYAGVESGASDESDENTYVGYKTGTVSSGGLNSFYGCGAGRYSSGLKNSYFGNNAGGGTGSSGNFNSFYGAEAGFKNTSGFGNVFSGAGAGGDNTEGSLNVFHGLGAGASNEIGTSLIFIGANSGLSCKSGNGSICIGDSADTSGEVPINQLVFGQGVVSYGDNTVTFPNNLRALPSGTDVNFSSSGGGCIYPVSSSIRWKENVKDIETVLDTSKIYDLRPVTFNPSTGHGDTSEVHIGLIAEEVERIIPLIVPKDSMGRPSSVRYSILAVLLLAEMKKLKIEIADLKRNIS
jgi:hypothetical protein